MNYNLKKLGTYATLATALAFPVKAAAQEKSIADRLVEDFDFTLSEHPNIDAEKVRDFCGENSIFYSLNQGDSLWRLTKNVLLANPEKYQGMDINTAVVATLEAATEYTIGQLVEKDVETGLSDDDKMLLNRLRLDCMAYGRIQDGQFVDLDKLYHHEHGSELGLDGVRGDYMLPGDGICLSQSDLETIISGKYTAEDVQPLLDRTADRANEEIKQKSGIVDDIWELYDEAEKRLDELPVVIGPSITEDLAVDAFKALGYIVPGENSFEFKTGIFISNQQPETLLGNMTEVKGELSIDDNYKNNLAFTADDRFTFSKFTNLEGGIVVWDGVHGLAIMTRDGNVRVGGGPVLATELSHVNFDNVLNATKGHAALGGQFRLEAGNYNEDPFHADMNIWSVAGVLGEQSGYNAGEFTETNLQPILLFGADGSLDKKLSEKTRLGMDIGITARGNPDGESILTERSTSEFYGGLGIGVDTFVTADTTIGIGLDGGVNTSGEGQVGLNFRIKSRK